MVFRAWIAGALLILLNQSVVPAQTQSFSGFDENYQQQFRKWQVALEQERREQWLTLAGLFWLKTGENPFGSASNNAVVFPEKSAAHAGVLMLAGKIVTVRFAPDVRAMVNGKPVPSARLEADISGHPTMVEIGDLKFEVIQRGDRVGIRLWDKERAEAREYRGATFFPLVRGIGRPHPGLLMTSHE